LPRQRRSDLDIFSQLAAEPDNLFARPIGTWTLEKLGMLALYLDAFTRVCGGGYYVDGLSGPGKNRIRDARPPFENFHVWGSPLVALRTQPPFERCVLVELKRKNVNALAERAKPFGNRAQVIQGDVNAVLAETVSAQVPGNRPCFCLLDPAGTELVWRTIVGVARTPGRRNKPELLILFPLQMGIVRLLTTSKAMSLAWEERVDRVFPGPDWRRVYQDRLAGKISPTDAKSEYVALYCQGLKQLGYLYVSTRLISARMMAGGRQRELYYLIFASDSDTGNRIMKDVMERPLDLNFPVTQQPRLF
jgi:three-Cys-motif partner protein